MARTHTKPIRKSVSIDYIASPTAQLFHQSNAFVRGILGPVGSGKSVACCMEMLSRALMIPPNNEGIRQSRFLVARSTYPELKTTTIPTFLDWFGSIGKITYDSPITFVARLPLEDGTQLHWEVWFRSVDGTQDSLDALRSLEVTGAWLNEGHEFHSGVHDILRTRVGRYRPHKEVVPNWRGIIIDSNYGTTQSPLRTYVEDCPVGWEFFEQPPAVIWDNKSNSWVVNHQAENLHNLDGGVLYYERALSGMRTHNIKQLLACQWGNPRSDKPVFPEFNSREHVIGGLIQPDRRIALVVGMDFGLHVAAVVTQLDSSGRLIVFDELWNDDASLDQFCDTQLLPLLHEKYRGFKLFISGDPSGKLRSAIDKRTAFGVLRSRGFTALPVMTNDPVTRRDALRAFLTRTRGFMSTNRALRVVEGLSGAVGYKRRPDGTFSDVIAKTAFSHTVEALEYAALMYRTPHLMAEAERMYKRVVRPKESKTAVPSFFYG